MQWQRPVEILMIEDSIGDIELAKMAFRHFKVKCNLNIAFDGEEGLAYLKRQGTFRDAKTPDLILLDINMPRMNGFELLEIIKTDDFLRSIPVIMLTSSESMLDVKKSYNAHANSYIVKPVVMEQFREIVRTIESFWINQSTMLNRGELGRQSRGA